MKDARAATDELESATRGASTVILGATAYEGRGLGCRGGSAA